MTRIVRAALTVSALATTLMASAVAGVAWAQEPGAGRRGGGPGIVSPEVGADRRVTFRLRAPEAKAAT